MKKQNLFLVFLLLLTTPSISQTTNNTLSGKVLYLSSGKKPAIGVKIIGSIDSIENANTVYTLDKGEFILKFPKARVGHKVNLKIGEDDRTGTNIELVNIKEVEQCRIPAKSNDLFEIIVCEKGERDLVAQRYYNIIKTSSDIALAKTKKELDRLLNDREKDYEQIAYLSDQINSLKQQTDSLVMFKEAFRIASINKDNATDRVLKYIQLLDEGKSIQIARQVLSIAEATNEMEESITTFDAAIEELETRAFASSSIFDYDDVIACYNAIINYQEKIGVDSLTTIYYYSDLADIYFLAGNYDMALENQLKEIMILENRYGTNHSYLGPRYSNIAETYIAMGAYDTALEYINKGYQINKKDFHPLSLGLSIYYNNIGNFHRILANYDTAAIYLKKSIDIKEKIIDTLHLGMATTYNNLGIALRYLHDYDGAIENHLKSINIRKELLNPVDPILAKSYQNIALVYSDIPNFKKAINYILSANDIREKSLSSSHPDLGHSYMCTAIIYSDSGAINEALTYCKKGLPIIENSISIDNPLLGQTYDICTIIYYKAELFDQALSFQEKAVDIFNNTLPKEHWTRIASVNDLLNLYYQKGLKLCDKEKYSDALVFFTKMGAISKRHYDYTSLAGVYEGQSYLGKTKAYAGMELSNQAIEYVDSAYYILNRVLTTFHPDRLEVNELWFDMHYHKALKAVNEKDYPSALQEFTLISMELPDEAISYVDSLHYILKKDVTAFQQWFDIHYHKAINAFDEKDYITALQELTLISRELPNEAISYVDSLHYILNKDVTTFHQDQQKINKLWSDLHYKKVIESFNEKNYSAALQELTLIPKMYLPDEAISYVDSLHYILNRDITISRQDDQLKISKLWVDMHYNEAMNAFTEKDYATTLQELTLISKENYGSTWNYIGLCHYYQSNYSEAITSYKKAIELSPEILEQYFFNNIGIAYAKNKQFKEAKNAFTEYEKLFPSEGRPYRNWAMYYALQNQKEKALMNLQKAIDLGYNDLEWLNTDDSLDNIRNEETFQKLIIQLEENQD